MTLNISLRQATLMDANIVAKIYLASRKKFVAFAPLIHSDETIYQWVLDTLIPSTQVFVAEIENVLIGMMAISKKGSDSWIEQLYILPEFVSYGFGDQFIAKAKSILHPPIYLRTFQGNWVARRFYERHGFKILEFTDGSKNEENCPDMLYEWRP